MRTLTQTDYSRQLSTMMALGFCALNALTPLGSQPLEARLLMVPFLFAAILVVGYALNAYTWRTPAVFWVHHLLTFAVLAGFFHHGLAHQVFYVVGQYAPVRDEFVVLVMLTMFGCFFGGVLWFPCRWLQFFYGEPEPLPEAAVEELRAALRQAEENEQFEEAARLRDRLWTLGAGGFRSE